MKYENQKLIEQVIDRVLLSENEERSLELIKCRNSLQLQDNKIRDIQKESRMFERQAQLLKRLLVHSKFMICDNCWGEWWYQTWPDWEWEQCNKCIWIWFLPILPS